MHKNKEPLFHIVKRVYAPWYFSWCVRAVALVLALACCAVISTIVTKDNPIQIFATIIDGSFGSTRKFMVLLQNTAMLLCVALALTPAFKMRFWNIGGRSGADWCTRRCGLHDPHEESGQFGGYHCHGDHQHLRRCPLGRDSRVL